MGKSTSPEIKNPTHNAKWDTWSYRIGCPVWGCKDWANDIYPNGTQSVDYLAWYSRAFPTVEGNSTFYAVPPKATFEKWRDNSAETFQFCFKFPRKISHDNRLVNCNSELAEWLERLDVLRSASKLGPTFLQLAPSFSFAYFPHLEKFLRRLPKDWQWAVEVRHQDWFDNADKESQLCDLLQSLGMDRVLFDSRPLNSIPASDATEAASQTRKPKSPFRTTITGPRPMVRLIGRNHAAEVAGYWEWWSEQIANWIREGYQPWIFAHAPDDAFAPSLARLMHDLIRLHLPELPVLPTWQSLSDASQGKGTALTQLKLF